VSLVLLDRDGVLNVDLPNSVRCPEELELIPNAGEAVRLLNEGGWRVVVVTNQAVVGRGQLSVSGLKTIHNMLKEKLKKFGAFIDEIIVCTDTEASPRRKPAPGMIYEALKKYQRDANEVYFVGDALRDMQAAYTAGCPRILVRTGKGKQTEKSSEFFSVQPVLVVENILEAAHFIVHNKKKLRG
jgi:D-glycero-D-manno-heptose 1,7-bisphosphate phosphatase